MALNLFEFLEQFMIDTFLITLTRFEETGSIGKIFISVGNKKTNFHFQKQKSIMFFGAITFLLLDRGVCFPLKKGNTLNLRSHKSIREKVNLSMKKKRKKIITTYIRV